MSEGSTHESLRLSCNFRSWRHGGIVVTFPDVPEAISKGDDMADARAKAADALGVTLLTPLSIGRGLPAASQAGAGQILVTPDADVSAKLALIEAFQSAGLSKTALAARLGKDEREVRRILDPDHPTKLPVLSAALAALGMRLVIGTEAA